MSATRIIAESSEAGWQRASLGKVLPIKYGKSLPAQLRDASGKYPVFGSSGVVGTHSVALTNGPTLIVGRKGNVGAVHYSAVPCWPIDTAYFVEGPVGHNLRYYKYLLESLNLRGLDRSTAIPGLSRDDYNAVEVSVAPPERQDEIVSEIDKQFSRLDEAVANLQRVKANLKRYKASVLQSVTSGRLSTDSCRSLGVEGWRWLTIADLASRKPRSVQSGPFGSNLLHSEFQRTGKLVIGIDNVQDGVFSMGSNHRISEAKFQQLVKYAARPQDVLITVMATVGRVCVLPQSIEPAIITKHVYRITVDQKVAVPAYVGIALRGSREVRAQLRASIRGQTRPGLNGGLIKKIRVPVPPLEHQSDIVAEVDRRLSIVREVEAEVDANLKRAQSLRQAILARAFSGARA